MSAQASNLDPAQNQLVTLPRYVEPKPDVAILLDRLGLTLPDQPPPKISNDPAKTAKTEV